MIAPISQVAQVLNRLQQAKVGIQSLDQIMALPVDDPGDEHRIQLPAITGGYSFHAALFRSADPNAPPAVSVDHRRIEPVENDPILCSNGTGPSTLFHVCPRPVA